VSAGIFIEAIGMDGRVWVPGGVRRSLMNPSQGSTFPTHCTRFPVGRGVSFSFSQEKDCQPNERATGSLGPEERA